MSSQTTASTPAEAGPILTALIAFLQSPAGQQLLAAALASLIGLLAPPPTE